VTAPSVRFGRTDGTPLLFRLEPPNPSVTRRRRGKSFWPGFPLCASAGFSFSSRVSTQKKGCDLAIQAFSRLASANPDVDLVMAGPDEEGLQPRLKAQAKRLQIGSRVHWTGMLQDDLKWGAFHAAEAFLLPSHHENFGVAVVEALACRLPVLISDKVNIWPEILHDEAGIVNPDTVEGTYRSMAALLAMQPEERQCMVSNGLACFRARYEMNRTTQALNDLFRSLQRKPSPPGATTHVHRYKRYSCSERGGK